MRVRLVSKVGTRVKRNIDHIETLASTWLPNLVHGVTKRNGRLLSLL